MKTILVDTVHAFVIAGEGIFEPMHRLLEEYPNKKILLTGANEEEREKFGLNSMPYEMFTLEHNPNKIDPKYFEILLKKYNLEVKDVIYFEHSEKATESAKSIGIITYFYDENKRDLTLLKKFIDENL